MVIIFLFLYLTCGADACNFHPIKSPLNILANLGEASIFLSEYFLVLESPVELLCYAKHLFASVKDRQTVSKTPGPRTGEKKP